MIADVFNFLFSHQATLAVAGAWLVREAHNIWPFLKANGGARGILNIVLTGSAGAAEGKLQLSAPVPPTETKT